MKTFLRNAAMLVAFAAACQASLALAEDFQWVSGGNSVAADKGSKAASDDAVFSGVCENNCDNGCKMFGGCDCDPSFGVVGQFGFDAFKGAGDSVYQDNFGVVTGLNAAMPVPWLSEYGIGWQAGMTYGAYDFDGRATSADSAAETQQQIFVTTGFYRKAREGQRFSAGIVYDWMLNTNAGYQALDPTFGQWRGQIEYALSETNGIGVYGTLRDRTAKYFELTAARPINQANLFWHHKFCSGADSWLWFGFPEQDRLNNDGSLYDWLLGASVQVPISERLALYGNAQYVHPSSVAGATASAECAWNVGGGIAWYFGGHAVSHSLNGKCWMPYMPVANNSTFLVDPLTTP
ncbi:MAG: DUF6666 family protein [Thermoguttaceae bacterium]